MRTRSFGSAALVAAFVLSTGSLGAQVWEVSDRLLKLGTPQENAQFGSAVAIGDFDGDGDDDLVVGAKYWSSPSVGGVGRYEVFLAGPSRQLVSQGGFYILSEDIANTGATIAAGDFDDDGRDEIALGRPRLEVSGEPGAGAVTILEYAAGEWDLTQTLSQLDTAATAPEGNDNFGLELAVGDFDGDGYEDLAVSASTEGQSTIAAAGIVHLFYGGMFGLRTDNDDAIWAVPASALEQFGSALAAGDFDADGYDDLAVGVAARTIGAFERAGAVQIYLGGATGIVIAGPQIITEATFGGTVDEIETFGIALAAGNFDQSPMLCSLNGTPCYDDLAIGVALQDILLSVDAGKVVVAQGGPDGIQADGATTISQGALGSVSEDYDNFGLRLAAGSLDRSGSVLHRYTDLAIGTPSEGGDVLYSTGYVHLVFGSDGGINTGPVAQGLAQEPGFGVAPAASRDYWGDVLAIGDLDDDGWGDLVVGVPEKDVGGVEDSGVVQVLYGALFADGFESHGTTSW